MRSYYTLADYPLEMVEIECAKCGRHGRLLVEHGPDVKLPDTRSAAQQRGVCQVGRACWRGGKARLQGSFAHARHACGFALANKGHDTRALQAYLGHKNIQHTVRYTELSPDRFKDFWR